MHFAPDAEDSIEFAIALANTDASATRSHAEELTSPAELIALLDAYGYTGRRDGDDAELADVRRTRGRIRALWALDRDAAVTEVNALLADVTVPYLTRHGNYDWHLHATSPSAPLAERIRVEVALALVDVIRTDEWGRLRVCAAPDCEGLLADFSRNGSKRFCSVRCGNRMNQLAFRERAVTVAR